MELRDGKRLDTTPGKVVLIRSPRRPSPVRQLVFAREDEREAAEGVAEPSVIAGHASPVARLANSLRLATGSISSRLFGASPSSSSAVPRPTSITDTQPSIAILPRAQTPASPFDDDDDGDRFNHAVDNNVQWNDDVLDDDDMASIAPTDFTPMATHRLRSSTPTLEESERRWIRDVAAWTSRYGMSAASFK